MPTLDQLAALAREAPLDMGTTLALIDCVKAADAVIENGISGPTEDAYCEARARLEAICQNS